MSDSPAEGSRGEIVRQAAALLCERDPGHPVRVAVDGVTASGKSTLAGELAAAITAAGRPVIHLTMDGYHHPRAHRYRQGRLSARGYYDDAYDFAAFARNVLVPLGPGGDRRYRKQIIDLPSDKPRDEPPAGAPADAVLVVDGSFLQRPELAPHWDHVIFVRTDLATARARGTTRDAGQLGGLQEAERMYGTRYHAAARIYLAEAAPEQHATLIFDNHDLARPRLLAAPRDR
jgi:uridine kinase